jgi:phytoene synthase
MQDAFSYCANLVRTADHDRFLSALFAPADRRDALYALYAFNIEVARVREMAREPLPGEIRLQWWSEVLGGERSDEASANPVAAALLSALERYRLPAAKLIALVEARRFDLYDEPMATLTDLQAYAASTAAAVIALAARILGVEAEPAAEGAGMAYAINGLLQAFPLHAARHQLYVPTELLERHQVHVHDVFAGRSSGELNAALAEMRSLARRHLVTTHERVKVLPRAALPAFLPVALIRSSLARLERADAFAPTELSPWRRQWLLWRAARNPARVAG